MCYKCVDILDLSLLRRVFATQNLVNLCEIGFAHSGYLEYVGECGLARRLIVS